MASDISFRTEQQTGGKVKRIAVASDDGKNIAAHFGRSRMFVIFEVDENGYRRIEERQNRFTAHQRGECGSHQEGVHHHQSVLEALKDCSTVICRGMGQRALLDLERTGIKPLFITRETDVEGAIQDYLAGRLSAAAGVCCGHKD
jgi:nitrogen fixation protein NifX